jgi:hypothetical protein
MRTISQSVAVVSMALSFALASDARAQQQEQEHSKTGAGQSATPSFERPDLSGASDAAAPAVDASAQSLCAVIEAAAIDNGLPAGYFARVIWQESRLKPDALGPPTRSGARAQGIAQFMPATAAERVVLNPFDPFEALPKSAEFLRDLRAEFGNLGLAAAAYNAGPQRVRDWLAGKRRLPSETVGYVRRVTGRSADEWKRPGADDSNLAIPADAACTAMAGLVPRIPAQGPKTQPKPTPAWVVQLIGDRSESNALAGFRELRKKYPAILGPYEPLVVHTSTGASTAAVWHRVRVAANSRQAAESLCSRLRGAGGSCLVQRD